ncbi:MAG: tRNA (adenosine(37)-N6)-threonylcarbamoyltransferase complex ATPase subunit type 1 TsaE [Bacteroidales bacterium]|nr:tRNA (adenosine(37)-N6)-threonylcarbamoyltransferase complex ATPase subunit type 1 TsaE [Bacteroidales bacterium]
MATHKIEIPSLAALPDAAERFLKEIGDNRLIAFYAPMGAGKTTFTTALCHILGVRDDAVSSPTFAIVNEYKAASGDMVYHFDFYRISRLEEALDIGLYDYLDSGNLCLMEWPENIEPLLPEETLKVSISVNPDGTRIISWEDPEN